MSPFVCTAAPARVVFGAGSLQQLPREVEALGATRVLVLSTPTHASSAEGVAALLGKRAAGIYAKARMHVPSETARGAHEFARRLGADCAVAIGGGSTGRDPRVLPATVITSAMSAIAPGAEGFYAHHANP
jgi:maleylacetate reductase